MFAMPITIDDRLLEELTAKAVASPRRRANHNFHLRLDDPVQRLLNAIEPGTYIRPQRHTEPATFEIIYVVRGTAVLLLFNEQGVVTDRFDLTAAGPVRGAEIPPGTWHTVASCESGTVFLEVKRGPYVPPQGANVAAWAPLEHDAESPQFEQWFRTARVGDLPPKRPSRSR
jgi:cupin fold WbuC family metalloprotein